MSYDGSDKWSTNISMRMAQLGISHGRASEVLGVSLQGWYSMRERGNPTARTMAAIGAVLACPHHLLLGGTPAEVAGQEVPSWDHLSVVATMKEAGESVSWQAVVATFEALTYGQ